MVRLKRVDEKFALQEIDGKIEDIFYQDMNDLNKLAYPMLFCLEKYGCMVLTRIISFEKPTHFSTYINYIFFDKAHQSALSNAEIILKSTFKNVPSLNKYNPNNNVAGFANSHVIGIFIPINPNYLPFGLLTSMYEDGNRLNDNQAKQIKKEIADKYVGDLIDYCQIRAYEDKSINTKEVLDKFKEPTEELNSYYSPKTLKQKKEIPVYQGEKRKHLITLKHEITHVYDEYTGAASVNHFSFVEDPSNVSSYENIDKSKLGLAINILYTLWSRTEFNAYTQSFGKQGIGLKDSGRNLKSMIREPVRNLSIGRPTGSNTYVPISDYSKNLSSDIATLENYNDLDFWKVVKEITVKGNNDNSTKNRISKMTDKEFKTYFIKTSNKLLEKFKDKTIKNSTQQALYNKDSQILARKIRVAIDENIAKHNYNKNAPFEFSMSFLYYFVKESSDYPVNFSMLIDTDTYLKNMGQFSDIANVDIQCKKLNKSIRLSSYVLIDLESFYNLYQELVTKQRKSYLDKIAIELSDDIRYILDKKVV